MDGVTLKARDGRRLRAPIVVAADGVHSVIAKRLGVNARWPPASLAIDMMEETPSETLRADRPDELWVAYAYNGLDGYAYVFPKTRHVNVGIGCLLSHFKGEMPGQPYDMQQKFVGSLVGSRVLHGRSDRRHFTPFLIPVGGPLPSAHRGRVLFAGDAGGFVHAVTAEGIYYAMVSGELAARAIVQAHGPGPRPEGRPGPGPRAKAKRRARPFALRPQSSALRTTVCGARRSAQSWPMPCCSSVTSSRSTIASSALCAPGRARTD